MHKTIFSMIYYGKGGWTWDDLYNHIPVFLRNFYLKEMMDAVQRENKATEEASRSRRRGPSVKTK